MNELLLVWWASPGIGRGFLVFAEVVRGLGDWWNGWGLINLG